MGSLPLLIIFINSSTYLFLFLPTFFLIWFVNHFRFHSQNPNIPGPCLTTQSSRRSSCSRVHSTSRYFAQTRQLRIAHFLSLIRKQGSHFIPQAKSVRIHLLQHSLHPPMRLEELNCVLFRGSYGSGYSWHRKRS